MMVSVIGIDSRVFTRESTKWRNGSTGKFTSVTGIAVKVKDYYKFDQEYKEAIETSLRTISEEID
jgi:putative lipoic acid-binding regulatory protein